MKVVGSGHFVTRAFSLVPLSRSLHESEADSYVTSSCYMVEPTDYKS